MTLSQRLLLTTGFLAIAITAVLGLAVREAWRRTEEARFLGEFHVAVAELQGEIRSEVQALPQTLRPLCDHEPAVDSALVGRRSGDLAGRRLSIGLRVPEMMRANRLDELTLLTDSGEILGRGDAGGALGGRDEPLAERARGMGDTAHLRASEPQAWEASCVHGSGARWVALVAARHVGPLMTAAARRHGLELRLASPERPAAQDQRFLTAEVTLPELPGQRLEALRSRTPLTAALRNLDFTIAALGIGTLCGSLLLSVWVARSLARPVVQFARQAREVVRGTPQPIAAAGGRELEEAAAAFNQTLADLAAMKKRLAATERIAARREVARRVAHEIKNPLAPIRASIETLRRLHARGDAAFDEYFDEASRTVLQEVTRINHIVAEFTNYERLPAPNPAPLDVVETVRSVARLHDARDAADGPRLELHTADCPPVTADRDQLVQVLTNLIQNAQDAAGAGREAPGAGLVRVSVGPAPEASGIQILVEDDGPGVSEAMQARLFEPYATSKTHGTGLGLAIVQRIAVEHGGDIVYRPSALGGAAFVLTLPWDGPTKLPE